MNQERLSCVLHDYIEIACLYGYRVKLELIDGLTIEGKAVDVLATAEKREFLIIENGERRQIELNRLAKMVAITPNAVFKEVVF